MNLVAIWIDSADSNLVCVCVDIHKNLSTFINTGFAESAETEFEAAEWASSAKNWSAKEEDLSTYPLAVY